MKDFIHMIDIILTLASVAAPLDRVPLESH